VAMGDYVNGIALLKKELMTSALEIGCRRKESNE
jgi:hypothetical protein